MKKGTAVIGFLLFNVFSISFIKSAIAEKYICSAELSSHGRPGEVETKTYKREGNFFVKTSKNGQDDHSILKETNSFMILTKTYNYPDLFITIIDKKKINQLRLARCTRNFGKAFDLCQHVDQRGFTHI